MRGHSIQYLVIKLTFDIRSAVGLYSLVMLSSLIMSTVLMRLSFAHELCFHVHVLIYVY